MDASEPSVVAVHAAPRHQLGKQARLSIHLLPGLGVEGDAHCGANVKHRSRAAIDPTQPNLRQVHLMPVEVLQDLRKKGFCVGPGALGENITVAGVDLLAAPAGTRLRFEGGAELEVTGLRNPCRKLNQLAPGLMAALLGRDEKGGLMRLAGVMGIVLTEGMLIPGAGIQVLFPPGPPRPLEPV